MALKFSSIFRGGYGLISRPSSLYKSVFPSLSAINNLQGFHQLSTTHFATSNKSYNHLLTETRDNNIGLITLNRPKALNALCIELLDEIVEALMEFEKDDNISAIIITGSGGKNIKYIKKKKL